MSALSGPPPLSSIASGGSRTYGTRQRTVDWRARIEQARVHLRVSALRRVVQTLEPLLESTPASAQDAAVLAVALAIAGRAFVDLGRDKEGMPLLQRAVEMSGPSVTRPIADPEDAADIAAALRYLARSEEAVPLLEAAIASATSVPWRVRLELGRVLSMADRLPEAIAALSLALEDKPGEPFVLRERAACFERSGDSAAALADLTDAAVAFFAGEYTAKGVEAITRAVEIAPDDPMILAQAAYALQLVGEETRARVLVDRLLAGPPGPPFALYLQSLVLWQQDRLPEAAEAIDSLTEQFPTDAEAVSVAVGIHLALDEQSRAREVIDRALAIEPADAALLRVRGGLLRSIGDWQEALGDFAAAIEQDPNDVLALRGAAACELQVGLPDKAVARLEQAVALTPDDVDVRNEYAEGLRATGRDNEALRELHTVLATDPENAFALGTRGQIRITQPSARAAGIEDLRAAASLAPGYGWVILSLGHALIEEGDVAAVLEAVAGSIDNPDVIVPLARELGERGWTGEAIDLLRRSYAARPTHVLTEALIDLLHDTGRFGEVVEAANGMLEQLPARSRAVVADALRILGRTDDARSLIDRVLADEPHSVVSLLVRSRIASDDNDPMAAERYAREAVSQAPDSPSPAADLGQLLRARGAYAEAEPLLARAYADEATRRDVAAQYADCLLMLGRAEEAMIPAEAAVRDSPHPVFAAGVLAAVLRELGRYEEALTAVELAVQRSGDKSPFAWIRREQVDVLIQLDRAQEALEVAETLAGENPEDPEAHIVLADLLSMTERPTDAVHAVDRALALGENRGIREYRCRLLLNAGRYEEIIETLEPLLRDAPPVDPWTPSVMARALLRLAPPRADEALSVLKSTDLAATGTQKAVALCVRAEALFALRDFDGALSVCREIASVTDSIDVPVPVDLALQGWAELKLGKIRRAARSLTRSLELSADPDFQFLLGLVMLHAGDQARAAFEYKQGLALADALPDPARRQCALAEALHDLNEATDVTGSLSDADAHVHEVKRMLRERAERPPADESMPTTS